MITRAEDFPKQVNRAIKILEDGGFYIPSDCLPRLEEGEPLETTIRGSLSYEGREITRKAFVEEILPELMRSGRIYLNNADEVDFSVAELVSQWGEESGMRFGEVVTSIQKGMKPVPLNERGPFYAEMACHYFIQAASEGAGNFAEGYFEEGETLAKYAVEAGVNASVKERLEMFRSSGFGGAAIEALKGLN